MTPPRTTSPARTGPGRHRTGSQRADSEFNIVMLCGRLSRPAELRILPSGDRLVALELSIPRVGGKAESVPVVWNDPPAVAEALDVDQSVIVLGRVRRRFFRAGGATQSRTEVVAETVLPARQTRRARSLVAKAKVRLEEAAAGDAG